MPVTARLSRKIHEAFGDEAAGDMVDWMDRIEAQRSELGELNELNFARVQAQFNELRTEINARFVQFEATIVGRLETKIEQRTADLMKWSFIFWVGAVAAVAALAGVLR